MKQTSKILIPVITLAMVLVSACNAPATATPTADPILLVNTAVAQTLTAQASLATATPRPTQTATVTNTPAATETAAATSTSAATSVMQNYCDNSLYVADVTIPDNTEMAPGQAFDKTWTIKNTGTCTWTEGYTIVFSNGEKMNGNTRPIGQSVAPGATVNVTVKLTAPYTPGAYSGFWRLANGKGDPFGQIVSVVIKVVEGATTTTPTPEYLAASPTPESSATATPTPTGTKAP